MISIYLSEKKEKKRKKIYELSPVYTLFFDQRNDYLLYARLCDNRFITQTTQIGGEKKGINSHHKFISSVVPCFQRFALPCSALPWALFHSTFASSIQTTRLPPFPPIPPGLLPGFIPTRGETKNFPFPRSGQYDHFQESRCPPKGQGGGGGYMPATIYVWPGARERADFFLKFQRAAFNVCYYP